MLPTTRILIVDDDEAGLVVLDEDGMGHRIEDAAEGINIGEQGFAESGS